MRKNKKFHFKKLDIKDILSVKRQSIKFQFTLFTLVFSFILVGTIGYFAIEKASQILKKQSIRTGKILVSNLASASKDGILLEDELLIYEIIDGIIKEDHNHDIVYIMVLNPKGRIITHSNTKLMGKKKHDPFINKILKIKEPYVTSINYKGEEVLDFSYPIYEKMSNKKIGIARLGLSYSSIEKVIKDTAYNTTIIFSIILFLGIIALLLWVKIVTKPIYQLAKGAEIIGSGNLDYKFSVQTKNEIGKLADIFNKMTIDLAEAQQEVIEKKQLEHELELARLIQNSLLPKKIPEYKNINIEAFYQSAKEVGGDYYDFIEIDHDHLGIVIADVSGKSIPGAFFMGITQAIMHLYAEKDHSPSNVLKMVNKSLESRIKKGMFVTMMYAILNISSREFKIASAGHEPLYVFNKKSKVFNSYNPKGTALGIISKDKFNSKIIETKICLKKDDIAFFITDGITEAMNNKQEEFGEKRIENLFNDNEFSNIKEIKNEILKHLDEFTGDEIQSDDITFVLVNC